MYQHEERQYLNQQRIRQEQPAPKPWVQVVAALAFMVFIIAIPAIADKLGK